MKKKLIVANWKANPESAREVKEIFLPVKRALAKLNKVEVVICPPVVFLADLAKKPAKNLAFGGQDAFWETAGAYTGQVGPTMFRHSGAAYLILGHSEARALGDSDKIVNLKLHQALRAGLTPILCVGEAARDERGEYLKFLRAQVEAALFGLPRNEAKKVVLAYEPVWAIGDKAKGADTPAAFLEQAIFLRKVLSAIIGPEAALLTPILYGGSVKPENAAGFLNEGEADGLLVGRASLEPSSFIRILKIANEL